MNWLLQNLLSLVAIVDAVFSLPFRSKKSQDLKEAAAKPLSEFALGDATEGTKPTRVVISLGRTTCP